MKQENMGKNNICKKWGEIENLQAWNSTRPCLLTMWEAPRANMARVGGVLSLSIFAF
jgi:hypothetical protein